VRDQVENGDSKSRKGVSHLTVSRGVTTLPPPLRGAGVFVPETRNTMRDRDTGSQRTAKLFLDDGNVDAISIRLSANRMKTGSRRK